MIWVSLATSLFRGARKVHELGNPNQEPGPREGLLVSCFSSKGQPSTHSHLTNSRPAGKQAVGSLQTLPLDAKNVLWLGGGQTWDPGPAPGPAAAPCLPVSSVSHPSPVSFIFPSCAMRGLNYISHFYIFVLQQNGFILNKAYTVPWCLKQINDALVKEGRGLLLSPPR